jgi:hypothetical protein
MYQKKLFNTVKATLDFITAFPRRQTWQVAGFADVTCAALRLTG